MNKVLILGGEGMLGQMILNLFSGTEGIRVKHTSRGQQSDPLYFDVEEGLGRLHEIVENQGPFDYLINCIGILSSDIDERNSQTVSRAILVNSLFPRELSTLTQDFGTRVIHMSTDGVFRRNSGVCLEDTPLDPDDVYGKTKSLGEVFTHGFLNLRCSVIGPSPVKKGGLLEWFLSQPQGGEVYGYTDQMWNGVTTLQFAKLCRKLILKNSFEVIREEGPVHHFCPNKPVSKYDLLVLFRDTFRPNMTVKPGICQGGPLCRILDTRYKSLRDLFGYGRPMKYAVNELLAEI